MTEQNTKKNVVIQAIGKEDADTIEKLLKKINDSATVTKTTAADGSTVINVELTEEEIRNLNDAVLKLKIKTGAVKVVVWTGKAMVNIAEYVVKDVAMPIFKAGVTVGASALRIGAEATVIGASAVTNVIKNEGGKTFDNIKENKECVEAANAIKGAFGRVASFLGAGNNITITSK